MSETLTDVFTQAYQIGMDQISSELRGLVELVFHRKINHILEIGTARGGSFYLWCKLADPDGYKISIDLPGGPFGGAKTLDKRTREKRDQLILSWSRNIHLLAADSHLSSTSDTVAAILNGRELDFLFIDGDHSYNGVLADYEMYRKFVRHGGYIAFHDINDSDFHRFHGVLVSKLWHSLNGTKYEFNANKRWAGIGVLQID